MASKDHVAKTLLGDRVLYYKKGNACGHVAFVIRTHDDPHVACLVFYCPETHAWYEALGVTFGQAADRDYFVNPEG